MYSLACPSCQNPLIERALYCSKCGKQAKCKNCREILELDARACVMCGTPVGEAGEGIPVEQRYTFDGAVNTIKYHESEKSRSLTATFTNDIGKAVTETLNLLLANRIGVRNTREHGPSTQDPKTPFQALLPLSTSLPNETAEDAIDGGLQDIVLPDVAAHVQNLRRVFRYDDDTLKLVEKRLKDTSKIDKAKRLSCLFLYAHKLEKRDLVERAHLETVLEAEKVYDNHSKAWIANGKELFTDGTKVGLAPGGEEFAIKVLEEIFDENIPDKARHSSSTRAGSKKHNAALNKSSQSTKSTNQKSGRPGRAEVLTKLVNEGFFSQRRTIGDIASHCKSNMAILYKTNELSGPLGRFIRSGTLKREKNKEGQYEYYK